MHRILRCPGSARHDLPESGGAAADEGTGIHAVAFETLVVGPQDIPDEEHRDIVDAYVEYVNGVPGDRFLEMRLESCLIPDLGGTIDCLKVTPDTLHVVDLKSGRQQVDAAGNDQLKTYLILAQEYFPGRKRFFGSIVQPRVQHPQCEEFSARELSEHFLAIEAIQDSRAVVPGGHCRYCPLLDRCDPAKRYAEDLIATKFSDPLTVEECNRLIDAESVISTLVDRAKSELLRRILNGEHIPGWRAAQSLGNRAWHDEQEATDRLILEFGLNPEGVAPRKIKSPAQAEKLLTKADRPIIKELCHRPERGVLLVTENSKLPDYVPPSADVFSPIEE